MPGVCDACLLAALQVADIILSSWKVWKLYNTSTMDFHLFFCCHNAAELQVLPNVPLAPPIPSGCLPGAAALRPAHPAPAEAAAHWELLAGVVWQEG